jgi:hypothetical protein
MSIDWDDPVARPRLIESVGTDRYNEMIQQHFVDSAVSTVNGYRIRPVGTRWGRLFTVDGTSKAFAKLPDAEEYARSLPPMEG